LMKSNISSFSRINFNILSMFYAQCDNIGSMYKLRVNVIDDINSACAGGHLIFKTFLISVTLCLITHPYNPKYSRLQNKNRFHVNANGHLRMHCLCLQLHWPLIVVYLIIFILLMKSNISSFSRINFNILSMFYAQCDNIGSMYKLRVNVIDDTWQPLKQRWIIIRVFHKLTQKPVNLISKGFNFLKCRFSFLLML
jgi:hypothetical protein